MASSFQIDADLLAISRSLIDESRELLASLIDGEATRVLLKNSRAMIDESRRLLAALECSVPARRNDDPHHHATATPAAAPIEPSADGVRADADRNPATLSVNIFEKGSCFGWTVYSPTNDLLGRGTARNVCFGSKADIATDRLNVRFTPESGHRNSPRYNQHTSSGSFAALVATAYVLRPCCSCYATVYPRGQWLKGP